MAFRRRRTQPKRRRITRSTRRSTRRRISKPRQMRGVRRFMVKGQRL